MAGVLKESIDTASADGSVAVVLPEGTRVLGPDGQPLTRLDATRVESLPFPIDGYQLVAAFDFQPDGAVFDTYMTVTLCYEEGDIPQGISEGELVVAYYDPGSGVYVFIQGVLDTEANTVTFSVGGTSIYAVMVPVTAPVPATATLTPTYAPTATHVPATVTGTPTPAPSPTETPTPTSAPTEVPPPGFSSGDWTGIGLGVFALLALIIGLMVWYRRRKKWEQVFQEIGWAPWTL